MQALFGVRLKCCPAALHDDENRCDNPFSIRATRFKDKTNHFRQLNQFSTGSPVLCHTLLVEQSQHNPEA